MRYAELRSHVWMLWCEARHRYTIEPPFRAWIVERTVERTLEAQVHHDNATDELGKHLAHDYRAHLRDDQEQSRFAFWWQHVMNHGFSGDNPLAHIHKNTAVRA